MQKSRDTTERRRRGSGAARVSAPHPNMQNHRKTPALGLTTSARLTQAPPLRHCPATREQNPNRHYPQLKAIFRSFAVLVKCGLRRNNRPLAVASLQTPEKEKTEKNQISETLTTSLLPRANGLRISRAATTKRVTSLKSYLRTRFTRRYQPRQRRRLHALVRRPLPLHSTACVMA
jgi:hypothetical protein